MQHRRFRRQGSIDAGGGQDGGQEEEEESIFMKPSIRKYEFFNMQLVI